MALSPVKYTGSVELLRIENTQQKEETAREEESTLISLEDEFEILKNNYAISLNATYDNFAELNGNLDFAYTNLEEFAKNNPEFAKKLPKKEHEDNCLEKYFCCIIY